MAGKPEPLRIVNVDQDTVETEEIKGVIERPRLSKKITSPFPLLRGRGTQGDRVAG
jgi:hypothetical protein